MPSTGVGALGAARNDTTPATTDVTGDAIEYRRCHPWNAAAPNPMAADIKTSSMFVARMCIGTEAFLLRYSGKSNGTRWATP
jgi:hypothetical protein